MSAFQILLHDLVAHGGVTTYKLLMRRYGDQGYDYYAFTAAVHKARRLQLVTKAPGKNKPIVAVGVCPCCGRTL